MSAAAVAMRNALQTSVKKRQTAVDKTAGKRPQRVHKASFVRAQRVIKESLGITRKIESDALVSTGRCLEDVLQAIVERCNLYGSKQDDNDDTRSNVTLSGPMAIFALNSMLPESKRSEVSDYVNASVRAFYEAKDKK